MTRVVCTLTCLLAVAACRQTEQPAARQGAERFAAWAERFTDDWVAAAPMLATRVQWFSGDRQDALDRQLTLNAGGWGGVGGALVREGELARRGLAELDAIDPTTLSPDEQLSAAVVRWSLQDSVALAAFARHRYVFDQFNGVHVEFVNALTQTHPIRNARDVANYQARLEQLAPRLDEAIAEARTAARERIVPPRVVLERSMQQIDGLLAGTAAENPLVTTLGERMARITPAMAPTERTAATAAAERVVSNSIIPAYRRVRALLDEQRQTASPDPGVWRLPRGADFYAAQLASFTNTTMTAEEIHQLGLREVARIEGEMDLLLKQLGYPTGTVNARYAQLEASIQPEGPGDPRNGILASYEAAVRDAERRAAALFDRVPRAPVAVRREPPLTEKTAAAHYSLPAPDGSQPGIFWLPLPGPSYSLLRRRSLSHHEAVPGHHFQLALAQELSELPRYRRLGIFGLTSAYAEGWGLYAERLADENGWFEGDPQQRLGYLNSMLFRARRLVVDTGLHAKRWTREQAIDYGISAQEVERYIAWPGQACSYMVGQLRIVELREKARAALGPRFNIREFHEVVLGSGSVPLEVLTGLVDRWVAARP